MTEVADRATPTVAAHPLDPLSADELANACRLLKEARGLGPHVRICSACLAEPTKEEVRHFVPGGPLDRKAFIVVYDRQQRLVSEAVVSLSRGEVDSWRDVPGV